MSLKILTSCSMEWEEMHAITYPSKAEYAQRWGCEIIDHRGTFEECGDPWARARLWRETLAEIPKFDYLWFLGADTLITNLSVACGLFLDGNPDICIGLDRLGINSDSIFFRHTDDTLDLLERVIELQVSEQNEQEALIRVMGRTVGGMPMVNLKIVPQSWFNSYPYRELYNYPSDRGGQWTPQSIICHVPGEPYQRRLNFLREAAKSIVR